MHSFAAVATNYNKPGKVNSKCRSVKAERNLGRWKILLFFLLIPFLDSFRLVQVLGALFSFIQNARLEIALILFV